MTIQEFVDVMLDIIDDGDMTGYEVLGALELVKGSIIAEFLETRH